MIIDLEIIDNYSLTAHLLPDQQETSQRVFSKILDYFPNLALCSSISVCLMNTDDEGIKALNSQFLGKDKPTNVLSFPADELYWQDFIKQDFTKKDVYIGDIAFSIETLVREAQEQDKKLLDHYSHMLIHAVLHLIGYDHEIDKEAEIMESLEEDILSRLNIHSPYK